MSYAVSAALQAAVYQHLSADAAVTALVGADVFDAIPAGAVPPLYVALGPEKARDASDNTGYGVWLDFTVSVVADVSGFAQAKTVAGAVSDALVDAALPLDRGELVSLRFRRAVAARVGTGSARRIDLTFRARVADDAT